MIDFRAVNDAALANARAIIPAIIPGGKFRSLEYVVRNPRRADQHPGSFTINYRTGVWKDFATGDGGGDLISLVAFVNNCSQGDAARELANGLDVPLSKPNGHAAIGHHRNGAASHPPSLGVNASRGFSNQVPKLYHFGDEGPPSSDRELRRHTYKREGVPAAIKIKLKDGGYTQWYRVPQGWQQKKPDDYQPVPYVAVGLDPFDSEYDQLLWPEGEKDVDGLCTLNLPAFTFGGVGDGLPDGVAHYLTGRHLVILADNDDPGRVHAEKKAVVAQAAGAASIKIVHFPELP
jgi:putative DNA primase/helicase